MCGIVGVVGADRDVSPLLIDALKRLEYRGYDSAGIATLSGGRLELARAEGKLVNLEALLSERPLGGNCGIGHTRWATHGRPTESNAHPHRSGPVAVVHNGIIENYASLRSELAADGSEFTSDTDTETIAHLFSRELAGGTSPVRAFQQTLSRLEGAFALGVLVEGVDDFMLGARRGSPLVVGRNGPTYYLGSDALALGAFTDEIIYLEEGDWCVLRHGSCEIFNQAGDAVSRDVHKVTGIAASTDKGAYRHYMLKEIHEQPEALTRTIGAYVDVRTGRVKLPERAEACLDWSSIGRVVMVACGTAHYATRVAEYWFEQIAGIPAKCDIASEFRYREPQLLPGDLAVLVSQSGETADTLAALRYCKSLGVQTLAIVNVPTSTIAREADMVLPTLAGPEIGVASTKAFTTQLAVLGALAVRAGDGRAKLSRQEAKNLTDGLLQTPGRVIRALEAEASIEGLARDLSKARDVIFLGRGIYYPIALEGALKLKEITYIHAEGYASGELKHGPIALVDEATPIVFLAPADALYEKSISNLEEVVSRGGSVLLVSDASGIEHSSGSASETISMGQETGIFSAIEYAIPVQLLAYYAAVSKGTDVDQPRNLAKSVTVE